MFGVIALKMNVRVYFFAVMDEFSNEIVLLLTVRFEMNG